MHLYLRLLATVEGAVAVELWVLLTMVGILGVVAPPWSQKLAPLLGYTLGIYPTPRTIHIEKSRLNSASKRVFLDCF